MAEANGWADDQLRQARQHHRRLRLSPGFGESRALRRLRRRRTRALMPVTTRHTYIPTHLYDAVRHPLTLSSRRRPGPISAIGTGLRRCDGVVAKLLVSHRAMR